MSIEIDGFNDSDVLQSPESAPLANELTYEEAGQVGVTHTFSRKASEYVSGILFTALRDFGIIPSAGFDIEDFRRTARAIFDKSINPR